MIKVAVTGLRSDLSEWDAAQATPKEALPPLTPEQKRVAEQLHVPEELYQRSTLAGRRTAEKLLTKTEQFARMLQGKLSEKAAKASVESIVLDTWAHKFEIAVRTNGTVLPLHVAESIVDDLFDLGSENAEQRLSQLLEGCLVRLGVR